MTFDSLFQSIINVRTRPGETGGMAGIFVSLLQSAVLGSGVALLYRLTHRKRTVAFSFLTSLPLLAVITGFVINVIGNDMVRAFGLLGAISMVRFRTRVKRTIEMAYIFMAISLGLACGASLFPKAAAGLGIFAVVAGLARLLRAVIDWKRPGILLLAEKEPLIPGTPADESGIPE